MKILACLLFLSVVYSNVLHAKDKNTKLVVVLMIDQFRADYLKTYQNEFLPTKHKNGVGGFSYLMQNGAYFPYAQYKILHSLTCPGHATILTGSYPYQSGIVSNDWFDEATNKLMYCVEDDRYPVIGLEKGRSPKNLIGSTVGDELKNANKKSKMISISLKDRSSILMGGHQADLALWFEEKTQKVTSSQYYLKDKKLPGFVDKFNGNISQYAQMQFNQKYSSWEKSPATIPLTIDLSIEALKEYNLGNNEDADLLAISISTHDIVGHQFGSYSKELSETTLLEDQAVSKLLNALDKHVKGGLKNVVVVLSADHGVAPNVAGLKAKDVPAGYISSDAMLGRVQDDFAKKYKIKESIVKGYKTLNFYLDRELIKKHKLHFDEVSKTVRESLMSFEGVAHVLLKEDIRARKVPAGILGEQALYTLHEKRSGDVIVVLAPFYLNTKEGLHSHMTGYSYDRFVPLILAGGPFAKKEIPKIVDVVDLAPTLAYLLGIIPPAASEGRVLTEAF